MLHQINKKKTSNVFYEDFNDLPGYNYFFLLWFVFNTIPHCLEDYLSILMVKLSFTDPLVKITTYNPSRY